MRIFAYCFAFLENNRARGTFCMTALAVASLAFFIPPELCHFYHELCDEWRFLIHFDKLFHAGFFAALALLICPHKPYSHMIAGVLILILLGVGIEAIQLFIPGRGTNLPDVIANIIGVALGLALKTLFKSSQKQG